MVRMLGLLWSALHAVLCSCMLCAAWDHRHHAWTACTTARPDICGPYSCSNPCPPCLPAVFDGYAGWDPQARFKFRVVCARPYPALFMPNMPLRSIRPRW